MYELEKLRHGEVSNIKMLTSINSNRDDDIAHTIQGTLILGSYEYLTLSHLGDTKSIPFNSVRLHIQKFAKNSGIDKDGENQLYISKESHDTSEVEQMELYCYLNDQQWLEMWTSLSNGPVNLYFQFRLNTEKFSISKDGLRICIPAYNISISLQSSATQKQDKFTPKIVSHLTKCIDAECLNDTGSLRYRIANELALSLSSAEMGEYESKEALANVLYSLSSAFHSHMGMKNYPDALFHKNHKEFQETIAELEDEKKKKLITSRNAVWFHVSITDVLLKGEENTVLVKNFLEPQLDELQELAYTYCQNPNLVSPLLEWVLIDALIYVETIEFTRDMADLNTSLASSNKYLKPITGFKQIRRSLWFSLKMLMGETLALSITYMVAKAIDNSAGIGFWAAFSVITIIRWVRPKKNAAIENEQRLLQLLTEMVNTHNRLKTYDFNANLLKTLLHALEIRGAVFSSSIYNILDKRLRRESQTT